VFQASTRQSRIKDEQTRERKGFLAWPRRVFTLGTIVWLAGRTTLIVAESSNHTTAPGAGPNNSSTAVPLAGGRSVKAVQTLPPGPIRLIERRARQPYLSPHSLVQPMASQRARWAFSRTIMPAWPVGAREHCLLYLFAQSAIYHADLLDSLGFDVFPNCLADLGQPASFRPCRSIRTPPVFLSPAMSQFDEIDAALRNALIT